MTKRYLALDLQWREDAGASILGECFLEQSPSSEVHHGHRVCVNLVEWSKNCLTGM